MTLTSDQIFRYSRQIVLPGVGEAGQKRLHGAKVLIVGVGGLGSPSSLYLAGAGVGTLGIVDYDVVDESNLHRQIIHSASSVSASKLESARARLTSLNPNVDVVTYDGPLNEANAESIMRDYDMVIDGSDNFPTRYVINDMCMSLGKPYIYGAVLQYAGQACVFLPGGPCYRCLYPEPPADGDVPGSAVAGILGAVPGLIGAIQATEAMKLIIGMGTSLAGRLLLYDAMAMRFREISVRQDPSCKSCVNRTGRRSA